MADVSNFGGMEHDIVATALRAIYRDAGVRSQDVNLYAKSKTVPRGGRLALADATRKLPTNNESLYVFADLDPLSNWGHTARHLFFSPENGTLMHSESSQFPPQEFVNKPAAFVPLHVPKVFTAPVTPQFFLTRNVVRTRRSTKKAVGRRFAILFSGNSNNRHVNDMEFLFRVLCDVYDYKEENIYVLNYDGSLNYDGGPHPVSNWPGDNSAYRMASRIVGAGNLTEFDKVFATVSGTLKSTDSLLIHTNNHGGDASTYGDRGCVVIRVLRWCTRPANSVIGLPVCRSAAPSSWAWNSVFQAGS